MYALTKVWMQPKEKQKTTKAASWSWVIPTGSLQGFTAPPFPRLRFGGI
jgi:hypothetical protein